MKEGPIRRVSCEKGDAGEFIYGMLRSDGKEVDIFLDGVKQEKVITADADEGWVKLHTTERPVGDQWPVRVFKGAVEIRVRGRNDASA
jgi:hypothetical protein